MKKWKLSTFAFIVSVGVIIGIVHVANWELPMSFRSTGDSAPTSVSAIHASSVQINVTTPSAGAISVSTRTTLPSTPPLTSEAPTAQERIKIDSHENRSWEALNNAMINMNSGIKAGGSWIPDPANHLAIIMPYRDREQHLKVMLKHIHPFLQRQRLMYTIFVIEQQQPSPFNRGLLMNVGYIEAMKQDEFGCLILHDVDLLPEDNRLKYKCATGNKAKQLAISMSNFNYTIVYPKIFGGVTAVRPDQFKKANGFSNRFFGWGGEDSDFLERLQRHKISALRPSAEIARYTMLSHKKATPNPERFKLLKEAKYDRDGLNSLQYEIVKTKLRPMYTWILVSVNETAIMNRIPISNIGMNNVTDKRV